MFHKHRLEAISDAVFAIVMTLLVLDLKSPAVASSYWLPIKYFFIGPLVVVLVSRLVQRFVFKRVIA